MLLEGVAEAPGCPLERALERLVGERRDPAAVVADEMMVVMVIRANGLEARDTVPDVDPLDEP